ncbi:MAG: hypothetical protein HND47_25000 [Chloroflexi bacterium]|nr:hypothetical protein [Chloroflexota bacterium]
MNWMCAGDPAKGFTNKSIGVQLNISDRTVQGHLAHIFRQAKNCKPTAAPRLSCAGWRQPIFNKAKAPSGRRMKRILPGWRGLTQIPFAVTVLPLTLLLLFIASFGVNMHQQDMRTPGRGTTNAAVRRRAAATELLIIAW